MFDAKVANALLESALNLKVRRTRVQLSVSIPARHSGPYSLLLRNRYLHLAWRTKSFCLKQYLIAFLICASNFKWPWYKFEIIPFYPGGLDSCWPFQIKLNRFVVVWLQISLRISSSWLINLEIVANGLASFIVDRNFCSDSYMRVSTKWLLANGKCESVSFLYLLNATAWSHSNRFDLRSLIFIFTLRWLPVGCNCDNLWAWHLRISVQFCGQGPVKIAACIPSVLLRSADFDVSTVAGWICLYLLEGLTFLARLDDVSLSCRYIVPQLLVMSGFHN